jgi:two-component system chemotaxis sensor kinase CheA
VNIVVLRVDSRQFGLVVDEINDTEEIVVKPLRKQLKNVKTFAGASIMGDGRVALILDVPGLAQRANLGARTEEMAEQVTKSVEAAGDTRQTLLLFEGKGQSRMAIALSSVARLEEFAQERVEQFDGQKVVQYRGQILPLIRVGEIVRGSARFDQDAEGANQTPLEVVVCTEQGRSVGLVVDHILDIVEENVALEHRGESGGVLGAAVVQQRVTELLDVAGVVRATLPRLFEERAGV